MNGTITPEIAAEKCTGCGLCVAICPDRTLSMADDRAEVTGGKCLQCGHCLAVCPVEAITVSGIDNDNLQFATFDFDRQWLAWGKSDLSGLVGLMASRRSCRRYKQAAVPREMLADLVKIAITAPSGTNSQKWTFTVLDSREKVRVFGVRVAGFFRTLNRMAENPVLRIWSRLFGGNALGNYFNRYYPTIRDGLAEWDNGGRDLLFHDAPAVIVVATAPGASCPAEDAVLASQNILLAAHAMGLGTCLIGFAVSAIRRDPAIKDVLEIPREETVHAVITLGYPDEKYRRLTGRLPVKPRFPEIS
ncbi:MAG: nitroreductase family protein [Proteobacteria bacterium]|nr:nitroreductase family protein [Pseudomonadota bacterium]MBU1739689.1 nitroreductase family protein [Pseudomonadota bacterium]